MSGSTLVFIIPIFHASIIPIFMKSRLILWSIVIILFTPLWMRIAWEFSSPKVMNLMIVDKTVMNENSYQHRSVNWILDHEKYCKSDSGFYDINKDYYGFFPGQNEKFKIKDFDELDEPKVDSLSNNYDLVYFTDTYGILGNEWFSHRDRNEVSHSIYGGLSEKDLLMMRKMKEKKKLILTELHCIDFPTPLDVRKGFEDMFGMHWTGWMARYIVSLDTIDNADLPRWIVRAYKAQNGGVWNFKKSGILFFHEDGNVFVLEDETDLTEPMPGIVTNSENQSRFKVPATLVYPYWFDIWENKSDSNKIVSHYVLSTNSTGNEKLVAHHIPKIFPAIIERIGDYRFFYFAGDYADNPTKFRFAKLTGVTSLKFLMYNAKDLTDRNRFFWEFYLPMMQNILGEYYLNLHNVRRGG
jgi:hypothetical protein